MCDLNLLVQCFVFGIDLIVLVLVSMSFVLVLVLMFGNVELMFEMVEIVMAGFVIQLDMNWNVVFDYLFDDFFVFVIYWGVQIEDIVEELFVGFVIVGCFNG